MKNFCKGQVGSSLIQVMVLGSIMGTISLFMVRKGNETLKAIRTYFYKEEIFTYIQTIRLSLMDNKVCQNALGGISVNSGTLPNINDKYSDFTLSRESVLGSQGQFQITDLRIAPGAGNPNRADITIDINVDDTISIFGPSTFSQDINLFVELNGASEIVDCFHDPIPPGETKGVVEQAIDDFCKGAGATEGNVKCNLKAFNKNILSSIDCGGSGSVVGNIDEVDGQYKVHCVPNNFYLPSKSAASCSGDFANELTATGEYKCRNVAISDIDQHFNQAKANNCKHSVKYKKGSSNATLDCPDKNPP